MIDLFMYRISRELGRLAAASGGLDALDFAAGIGAAGRRVAVQVMPTDEQPMLARHACEQLAGARTR